MGVGASVRRAAPPHGVRSVEIFHVRVLNRIRTVAPQVLVRYS
jgi:hypothetical protein